MPRTFVSKPATVMVQAPAAPEATLGNGTATGTLLDDVWTPGRDELGRVNAASWALVPRQRWVTVAGTRLDGLDAAVRAAVPSWSTWQLAWNGILQAWNGFALDLAGGRAWIFGGGHSDGQNNGLYRFDIFRMAWAVQDLPSDRSTWASNYRSTDASTYPDNLTATQAKNAAGTLGPINDLMWDEVPDGKPTARHVYSSMVFVPETNEVVMACRRLWRYSLSSNRWNYKRLMRDKLTPWMDDENYIATYDEASREVLVSSSGSRSLYHSTGYHLVNNEWTDWSSPWVLYGNAADTRVGRNFVAIQPPEKNDNFYASKGQYWVYNLDSRQVDVAGAVQFGGGLSRDDFPSNQWFYMGAGIAYIPTLNRYWMCTQRGTGQMGFFEIDPTTTPWTMTTLAFAGNVPVPSMQVKRKLIYWPALNAVTLTDAADKDMHVFRF